MGAFILFVVILIVLWVVLAGARAVGAAVSNDSLNKELREGRVEIVKLFEQNLPHAAKEKYMVFKQRAETHCKQKQIEIQEISKFLPALFELQSAYEAAERIYHRRVTSEPSQSKIVEKRTEDDKAVISSSKPISSTASQASTASIQKAEISLSEVQMLTPYRLKEANAYYLAFANEHQPIRLYAVLYLAVITIKLNLTRSWRAMTWLKTVMLSLEIEDSALDGGVMHSAEMIRQIIEDSDTFSGKSFFDLLDCLDSKQIAVFVHAFTNLIKDEVVSIGSILEAIKFLPPALVPSFETQLN